MLVKYQRVCRFCIRKFYDLEHEDKIGSNPEENILSLHLLKPKLRKQIIPGLYSNSQNNQPLIAGKQRGFVLPRSAYQKIMEVDSRGAVDVLEPHDESDIKTALDEENLGSRKSHMQTTLISLNAELVAKSQGSHCANLFKLLAKQKPDLILLDIKPDLHLSDFKLIPKRSNSEDAVFSHGMYLKQITKDGVRMMPSKASRNQIIDMLKASPLRLKVPSKTQLSPEQSKEKAMIYRSKLSAELISTACLYSSSQGQKPVPIALSDVPETSIRQYIANTHTLMELQQILVLCSRQIPFYSQQSGQASLRSVTEYSYPEVFLHYKHRYLATLLRYIKSTKKYNKVVCIAGDVTMTKAVQSYYQQHKAKSILQDILPPVPKSSELRNIENFEIVEKHCLLDMIQYGLQIMNTPVEFMETTAQMIDFYKNHTFAEDPEIHNRLEVFRVDMYRKYLEIVEKNIKKGYEEKKKDFLRTQIAGK